MKVIVKAVAGSHLFGLNTENSDHDYKGVFIPDAKDIILGDYEDTFRQTTGDGKTKNSKDDVDTELYSLRKFFKMVSNGDTAALELLFTPDEMILEKTIEWDFIRENRDRLISKKVNALIGYTRQQANKYGIIGSRMGELNKVIAILKDAEAKANFKGVKLKHVWEDVSEAVKPFVHIKLITLQTSKDVLHPGIDVLGKKFDYNTPMSVINKCLSDEYKKYGERAREAKKNNGVDFKALSHALRCMIQGIELMNTGRITIPHVGANKEFLLKVKRGEIPYPELEPIIEDYMARLEKAAENSSMQETVDDGFMKYCLIYDYLGVIRNEVDNGTI